MKEKRNILIGLTLLVIIQTVSCSPGAGQSKETPTPEPTPTPVLSINGELTNTSDQSGREITLCKIEGDPSEYPIDCVVYDQSVTVDSAGEFAFYNVPEGTYFILYNYQGGGVDFQDGMDMWSGKTLKIGDTDWLEKNYFELFPDGEMRVMIKVGMPMELIKNPELLMAYYALTLQVSESPFVLAHTVNYGNLSSLRMMVDLVEVSVVNDQTADVTITLY
ncbi:MAG: hypothetical protein PWQ55_762 [Chloroflexota bacterium]|nr:hypothetical protein [Chloroflexota bacterium]